MAFTLLSTRQYIVQRSKETSLLREAAVERGTTDFARGFTSLYSSSVQIIEIAARGVVSA
jgi:hypothetical protein